MTDAEYIKKLERRIHMQRLRLRWWEQLFNQHVHSHYWSKVAGIRPELREAANRHGITFRRAKIRRRKAEK